MFIIIINLIKRNVEYNIITCRGHWVFCNKKTVYESHHRNNYARYEIHNRLFACLVLALGHRHIQRSKNVITRALTLAISNHFDRNSRKG